MARSKSNPWRTLAALGALILALTGILAAGVTWSQAQWTPKLALDLDGGTELVLKAQPVAGTTGSVTPATMSEAVQIERKRANGSGVSEAEVTTYGADSIVISLPGKNVDQNTLNALKQSASMEFRPVVAILQRKAPTTSPSASASASASGSASVSASGSARASGSASVSASTAASASATASAASSAKAATGGPTTSAKASSSVSGGGLALAATTGAAAAPTTAPRLIATQAGASVAASTGAPTASAAAAAAATAPTNGSDRAWLNDPAVLAAAKSTDCSTAEGRKKAQARPNDPKKPYVACDEFGYLFALGPVEVYGKDISSASAGIQTNSQGQSTGQWAVNLTFDSTGADAFAQTTARLFSLKGQQNQFAIVLDNQVISAPTVNGVISGGQAEISGSFTQASATSLANQLSFGALPISFKVLTENQISATLGGEQLQKGLIAGLVGLILVVIYSLLQYRALGMVTVGSLMVAGLLTYLVVVLLGWRQGYRLSLAGVAGLIVAIGITADSFIVYFERIRDEVREGRSLQTAVELAWARAKRTILISDAVSFLAAAVLYAVAVGGVKGFAFTLGLTTVVDIVTVFMFTKPVLTLLARTHFFGGGHKLSGFDAKHLGRQVTYVGRGSTRTPARTAKPRPTNKGAASGNAGTTTTDDQGGLSTSAPQWAATGGTIAERRAAAERAAAGEGGTTLSEPGTTTVIEEKD